jgi:peptide/nickel transport system permease protein
VFDDLVIRAPITAQLALMGLFMGLVVGIPLGALSAVYQNSPLDYVLRLFSITFLAVPNFWIALLVILGLAVWFDYYPPSGMNLIWEDPLENLKQLMWPSVILGSSGMATISRMTRSTMLEVMREDYIRTARAKGIQERVVIIRHAMKNALIPVITLAGLTFAGLMGGTVILESVFGIPGIGLYFIDAIRVLDYTIVQGAVVVFGLTFMGANLVVDLVYGWFDPRISYD